MMEIETCGLNSGDKWTVSDENELLDGYSRSETVVEMISVN